MWDGRMAWTGDLVWTGDRVQRARAATATPKAPRVRAAEPAWPRQFCPGGVASQLFGNRCSGRHIPDSLLAPFYSQSGQMSSLRLPE